MHKRAVFAPFSFDFSNIPFTKGVLPLAATPITVSFSVTFKSKIVFIPSSSTSSTLSKAFTKASLPPASIDTKTLSSIPKVGITSAASITAILPLVPAPA